MTNNKPFFNRLQKFPLDDKEHYEVLSSDITHEIASVKNKKNKKPILKVDINGSIVKFYVDTDIVLLMEYKAGSVFYTDDNKVTKRKMNSICVDAAIKKEIYRFIREYNIKKETDYSVEFNGIIVEDFIYIPRILDTKIYDKTMTNMTDQGVIIIESIDAISNAYCDFIENNMELSDEVRDYLKNFGLYDTFMDFLKLYS